MHTYRFLESLELASAIHAERDRCWRNAVLAMLHYPSLYQGGCYVEGWIVIPRETIIEVIEHGWTCLAKSQEEPRVLDPSIVLREHSTSLVFYFPGLLVACEQLCEQVQGQMLPLVCHTVYGDDGMLHPGYKRAYDQACAQARELVAEKHVSEQAIKVSGRSGQHGATLVVLPQEEGQKG